MCIEKNLFWQDGICLKIETSEVNVKGRLTFEELTPLKYDIMGPFVWIPFMECRHMVWSMHHRVNGKLCINGQEYIFENACGYWEGDKGRSFPKEYAWTHCFFNEMTEVDIVKNDLKEMESVTNIKKSFENSIMLSVADIPLARWHFTGMIGVVLWKGKEYRFATYLGAKVRQNSNGKLHIVQGNMELEAQLLKKRGQALKAPTNGSMQRTIYESAVCKAFYCFRIDGEEIFAFETNRASFEWQYDEAYM